jgi:hypothetical protein
LKRRYIARVNDVRALVQQMRGDFVRTVATNRADIAEKHKEQSRQGRREDGR